MVPTEIKSLKHLAFAVNSAEEALETYAKFLAVPEDTKIIVWEKSRTRLALFDLGGIEYQLCESMDPDGRFAVWIKEHGQGLHHICYDVKDIDAALAHAKKNGAELRLCQACEVTGSHPHPEGFVAFLDNDAGGIEIEFMQVYTPEELKEYENIRGI